jgi:hypothetical protein
VVLQDNAEFRRWCLPPECRPAWVAQAILHIGGEAILERILKNVRASNVSEVVLVLSIMAEIVAVRREEKWSNE